MQILGRHLPVFVLARLLAYGVPAALLHTRGVCWCFAPPMVPKPRCVLVCMEICASVRLYSVIRLLLDLRRHRAVLWLVYIY